ncbi:hypothetical protein F9L69_11685 [Brucella melitensis]|uniref:Uncharacterized protein n=3 Tax=Brucella TaxID=234 RepID=A0AAI8EA96_BRUSS|nr:hypothetical protein BMNI_II0134 [Brucella melitensis NI]AJM86046.1 hypothetical protein TI82_10445 [Brucella suis]ALY33186.1 hypothetical protein AWH03_14635 [Brucella suis 019]AOG44957.1 hypothetical protein BFS01_11055 [Brucella sp. 2002734562]AOG50978.1 hypothetical protein BFL33_10900 [Brucella melitensis]ASU72929.1 hypothetical protein CJP69_11640 [Brucella abortus]EEH13507.1 Hypothetical protein BCETI_6000453 [Brucella ceti str. Cudo]EPZ76788.1 hypothetical protein M798_04620 [Bruc
MKAMQTEMSARFLLEATTTHLPKPKNIITPRWTKRWRLHNLHQIPPVNLALFTSRRTHDDK